MTFLELCQTVRQEVGISGTGPSTVVGQEGQLKVIVDFVAEADYQIQALWHDWNFLWSQYSSTLSTGTRAPATTKPTDLGNWDMRSFYLDYTTDDSISLSTLSYVEWRADFRQGVATNDSPTYVVVQPDSSLIVDPPPDKAYTITADYWKTPTKMTANTDESVIPSQYHRIIVARAKTMWAEREEAPEILLGSSAEYQDLLDKLESQSLPGQRIRRFGNLDMDEVVQPV
tara:strand:+ start:1632 stop:2318 length:687 start_codon:yes stop_codon:yes gene_type:complete